MECFLKYLLLKDLDKKQYKILRNIMIPNQTGEPTQIDHIILSRFGIFVVELKTKTMGKIYCNQYGKTWKYYIGGKEYEMYNPIRQNYGHVKSLVKMTGIPEEKFYNVVVFFGDGELMKSPPENVVKYEDGLLNFILGKQKAILTEDELNHAKQMIRTNRIPNTWKNKKLHHEYVKRCIAGKE